MAQQARLMVYFDVFCHKNLVILEFHADSMLIILDSCSCQVLHCATVSILDDRSALQAENWA
jgi:hypothetical protein